MSEGLGCTAIHSYICTGSQWKAPDVQLCKQRCYHSRHSIIAWFVVRIIAWFVMGINVPINITTNLKLSRVLGYICSWWQMPLVSIQKVWTAFWPIAYLCFHQCLLSKNLHTGCYLQHWNQLAQDAVCHFQHCAWMPNILSSSTHPVVTLLKVHSIVLMSSTGG